MVVVSLLPVSWLEGGVPCAVRHMLGFDCPGCGLLRSWSSLLHGQWQQAVLLYPLGPLFYMAVWLFILDEIRVAVIRQWGDPLVRPWIRPLLLSRWIGLVLLLMTFQWIAKLGRVW